MLALGSFGVSLLLLPGFASAAVVDGTINISPDEYMGVLVDANGESYDPGMDIDKLYLDADLTYAYLGITVEDYLAVPQQFSFSGSIASSLTNVVVEMYADSSMTNLLHSLSLVMMNAGGTPTMVMALLDYAPLSASDYQFAVGSGAGLTGAFEVGIKNSLLPNVTGPGFIYVRLDDWGSNPDDEITGDFVPEPATISLLAIGGLAMLKRRRKK